MTPVTRLIAHFDQVNASNTLGYGIIYWQLWGRLPAKRPISPLTILIFTRHPRLQHQLGRAHPIDKQVADHATIQIRMRPRDHHRNGITDDQPGQILLRGYRRAPIGTVQLRRIYPQQPHTLSTDDMTAGTLNLGEHRIAVNDTYDRNPSPPAHERHTAPPLSLTSP